jgi:hypothetical protein
VFVYCFKSLGVIESMKTLIVGVILAVMSSAAVADVSVGQFADKRATLSDDRVPRQVIRTTSERFTAGTAGRRVRQMRTSPLQMWCAIML